MKYRFEKVYPCYTGGGIHTFIGKVANGSYFVASDCCYDVRLLNANVFEADWDEELFDNDWEESHLVADLSSAESLYFFKDMLNWVIKNEPNDGDICNYQIDDMKDDLQLVADYIKLRKEEMGK